jgi:hypothetical protein
MSISPAFARGFSLCYGDFMEPSPQELLNALLARRAQIDEQIAALERARPALDARIAEARQALTRSNLPCWKCDADQALDVRHLLGSSDCEIQMTPNGLPLNCCRVHRIGAIMGLPDRGQARGRA